MLRNLRIFQSYSHRAMNLRFTSSAVQSQTNAKTNLDKITWYNNKIMGRRILTRPEAESYLANLRRHDCKKEDILTAIKLFNDQQVLGFKPEERNKMIEKIWDEFKYVGYEIEHYNALYNTIAKNGHNIDLETLVNILEKENITPNSETFCILFKAACVNGDIKQAELLVDKIKSINGVVPSAYMSYFIVAKILSGEEKEAEILIKEFNTEFTQLGEVAKMSFHNGLLIGFAKAGFLERIIEFLDEEDCHVTFGALFKAIPIIANKLGEEAGSILRERCGKNITSYNYMRNITLQLAEKYHIALAIDILERYSNRFYGNSKSEKYLQEYVIEKTLEKYFDDEENLVKYLNKILRDHPNQNVKVQLIIFIWQQFLKLECINQKLSKVDIRKVLKKIFPDSLMPSLYLNMKFLTEHGNEKRFALQQANKYFNVEGKLKTLSEHCTLRENETWDNVHKMLVSDSEDSEKLNYLLKTLEFTPADFLSVYSSIHAILRYINVTQYNLYRTAMRFVFEVNSSISIHKVESFLKTAGNAAHLSESYMALLFGTKSTKKEKILALCRRYISPKYIYEKILSNVSCHAMSDNVFFEYFMCNLMLNRNDALDLKNIEKFKRLCIDYGTIAAVKRMDAEMLEWSKTCDNPMFAQYTSLLKAKRVDDANALLKNQTIVLSEKDIDDFFKSTDDLNTQKHFIIGLFSFMQIKAQGKTHIHNFITACIKNDLTHLVQEILTQKDVVLNKNTEKIATQYLLSKGVMCEYTRNYHPYEKVIDLNIDVNNNPCTVDDFTERLKNFTQDELQNISFYLLDKIISADQDDLSTALFKVKKIFPHYSHGYDPYYNQEKTKIEEQSYTQAREFLNFTLADFLKQHKTLTKNSLYYLLRFNDQEKVHKQLIEYIKYLLKQEEPGTAFTIFLTIIHAAPAKKFPWLAAAYIEDVLPHMNLSTDEKIELSKALLYNIDDMCFNKEWFAWCKSNLDWINLQQFFKMFLNNIRFQSVINEDKVVNGYNLIKNDPQYWTSVSFHNQRLLEIVMLNKMTTRYLDEVLEKPVK